MATGSSTRLLFVKEGGMAQECFFCFCWPTILGCNLRTLKSMKCLFVCFLPPAYFYKIWLDKSWRKNEREKWQDILGGWRVKEKDICQLDYCLRPSSMMEFIRQFTKPLKLNVVQATYNNEIYVELLTRPISFYFTALIYCTGSVNATLLFLRSWQPFVEKYKQHKCARKYWYMLPFNIGYLRTNAKQNETYKSSALPSVRNGLVSLSSYFCAHDSSIFCQYA